MDTKASLSLCKSFLLPNTDWKSITKAGHPLVTVLISFLAHRPFLLLHICTA